MCILIYYSHGGPGKVSYSLKKGKEKKKMKQNIEILSIVEITCNITLIGCPMFLTWM